MPFAGLPVPLAAGGSVEFGVAGKKLAVVEAVVAVVAALVFAAVVVAVEGYWACQASAVRAARNQAASAAVGAFGFLALNKVFEIDAGILLREYIPPLLARSYRGNGQEVAWPAAEGTAGAFLELVFAEPLAVERVAVEQALAGTQQLQQEPASGFLCASVQDRTSLSALASSDCRQSAIAIAVAAGLVAAAVALGLSLGQHSCCSSCNGQIAPVFWRAVAIAAG